MQTASILQAAEVDLDIADAAMAPLSGGTSQPNLNTLVEALRFTERDTGMSAKSLDAIAEYWRVVREFYVAFESVGLAATADLYHHEMPGGQYTNLYQQALALGLGDRWPDVCQMYADVNQLFGDIVKVTPTSKAVGDMALFLVANGLTTEDVLSGEREISYPESVLDLISGRMGQPMGGFPKKVKQRILRDQPALRGRPGATLPPADFAAAEEKVASSSTQFRQLLPETRRSFPLALSQGVRTVRRTSAKVLGYQHRSDACLLSWNGAGRRNQRRYRARQDTDHQVPHCRRASSGWSLYRLF
jgi:pyruvate carboxylase